MPSLQLWNSILLLLFLILVIYPTAKVIITGRDSITIWNELNNYPQSECTQPPLYIACVIFTDFQRFRHFLLACVDITIFETIGLLPSPSWELSSLGNAASYHTWTRRFPVAEAESQYQECEDLGNWDAKQACIKKLTDNDQIYVVTSYIVVILACLGFIALMIRYVRHYNAAASKENEQQVDIVGLERGLGSEGIDAQSASSNSDLKKDDEGNSEGWKATLSRQNSLAWRRFLRGGQSASDNLPENAFLTLPTSEMPPRIPTPALPSTAIVLSDSYRARMGLKRKPLEGLAAFEDDEFVIETGLVIPEIRVISTGSH